MNILCAQLLVCLVAAMANSAQRQKRQANFGGGSRQPNLSNSQASNSGTSGGNSNVETENKIFFGNPAIDNGLLGAGLGIGGILLAQNIANGNNQCNCGGRRKRQIQTQDPNQKFFGIFGGGNSNSNGLFGGGNSNSNGLFGGGSSNSNNCNCASNTGSDCKGRPQGDRFYGCGCKGNSNGGLFSFGRKKRQVSQTGEDLNNKILNFRCIQATLTGRNTNQAQFSVTRLSQG